MKYYVIFILALSYVTLAEKPDKQNISSNSSSATTVAQVTQATQKPTTPTPKINVAANALCKKCHCDIEPKILDCTNLNLTEWFNDNEWNILKNGDVQFETIRLDRNYLETVPQLPQLKIKKLILSNNKIKSIKPIAFKNLSQLEVLDLSSNRLTSKELTPSVFEGNYSPSNYEPLDKLVELNLANNELHTLDPDLFEHFPNLQKLSLSSNVFQVIDQLSATAIASIGNLKTLDLSYMELKTLPLLMFHAPREKLENLILAGNLFKHLPPALQYAINLKTLNLDENPLSNIEDDNVFPYLEKLEILSISFLKRTKRFGKGAFSKLKNLKELYATNNLYLNEIHPSAFAAPITNTTDFSYPPLEKLHLHNNNLTILPKTLLDRWDKVNTIDLQNNPWKCDSDNDFLIHDLYPQILKNTPVLSTSIICATPSNYHGIEIHEIYEEKKILRGPDRYGNNPENDGAVLIGILIGLLTGIPLAFFVITIYKRGCFGLSKRPSDYGGALYKRADFNDDI